MRLTGHKLRWQDALLVALAFGGVLLYVLRADGGFPLDDSWIHQVYGRNLAQRGEWAFIPGEPSAASTAPLYTVLLAAGHAFDIDVELWPHLWGGLALAVTALVGARLAERISGERVTGFVTGLALVLAWHLLWAAASGMETMLFSMWTLGLILLALREVTANHNGSRGSALRGAGFGVVAALATLTRPEGVMLAGLCGLALIALTAAQGDDGRRWRALLHWSGGAALAFVVVIAPYLHLNLNLTGGLLPATADAKAAQHAPLLAEPYPLRVLSLVVPLVAGGQVLLLPGAVYFGLRSLRRLRDDPGVWLHLLLLVWPLALVLLYAARLPAAYQHGRYVIPALPALIVAGVVGTRWLLRDTQRSMAGRVLARTLALAAAPAFLYFGLVLGPDVYAQDVAIIDEEMVAPAQWIAAHLPPDDLLAVHDIGAVGYFAPRPIVDIAGLVTPEIAPIYWDEAALWAFIEARGAAYLMAFPDQLPGKGAADPTEDPRLCPVYESSGRTSMSLGGPKMTIYRLAWDGACP